MGLVPYQCYYHTVEVEEKHYEMETKFDKRLLPHMTHVSFNFSRVNQGANLFVNIELPENLRRIQQVLIVKDPTDAISPRLPDALV